MTQLAKWELTMVRLCVFAGIGISGVVVSGGYGFWYRNGAWWGLLMAYFGKVMIFTGGMLIGASSQSAKGER